MRRKLLVVHGCKEGCPVWPGLLRGYGFDVRVVRVGTPVVSVANEFHPDGVLWDARSELADSLQLIRMLGWVHWIPIVVLLDASQCEFAAPLDGLGVVRLVRVPCTTKEILTVLYHALELTTSV